MSASEDEVAARFESACERNGRRARPLATREAADHLRYEELLYDRFTGFPTLPVMIERGREMLERRGRLTLLYIEFVRYSKLEEIYGWEKLDEVLQTTASAVRDFYARFEGADNVMMVSHTGDDDFIFFADLGDEAEQTEQRINEMATSLETEVRHAAGDGARRGHRGALRDLRGLHDALPQSQDPHGAHHLPRHPRGGAGGAQRGKPRAGAQGGGPQGDAARGRRLHRLPPHRGDGDARGVRLRGPGPRRAPRPALAGGAVRRGGGGQPHLGAVAPVPAAGHRGHRHAPEAASTCCSSTSTRTTFATPPSATWTWTSWGWRIPGRIVLEITERTAITDYPTFQGYLKEFRDRGFRFAVDDAGSGYAGLGSIANLEPDFIKLDISLISGIDANFMKQNLVETMVQFANDHGIKVIAEGVEREEEYETVKRLGVHFTQGFLFHSIAAQAAQLAAAEKEAERRTEGGGAEGGRGPAGLNVRRHPRLALTRVRKAHPPSPTNCVGEGVYFGPAMARVGRAPSTCTLRLRSSGCLLRPHIRLSCSRSRSGRRWWDADRLIGERLKSRLRLHAVGLRRHRPGDRQERESSHRYHSHARAHGNHSRIGYDARGGAEEMMR